MKALASAALLFLLPGNPSRAGDPVDLPTFHLPFPPGVAYHVISGPGDAPYHTNTRNRHAYDFALPLGSEVTAARAGFVVRTETRFDGPTGRSENNNFIVLRHDDGLVSEYHHLIQDGVLVRPGETVDQGEVIGFSGSSGKADGAHLHFVVLRGEESQPIIFVESNGAPSKGQLVRSMNVPTSLRSTHEEIEEAKHAVLCLQRLGRMKEAEMLAEVFRENEVRGSLAERRKTWALRPAREELERLLQRGDVFTAQGDNTRREESCSEDERSA